MARIGRIVRNLFVGLILLAVLGHFLGKSQNQRAHVSADAAEQSGPSAPPMPADEQRFLAIIQQYASRYQEASNDLAKGALRPARAQALCEFFRNTPALMATPWVGTVKSLSSNNDGKGVLAVQLADGITVRTTNNAISDSLSPLKTLIEPSSAVGRTAANLATDQVVHFTGRFARSDKDCVETQDLTQEGAMTEPDFEMQFTSLRGDAPSQ